MLTLTELAKISMTLDLFEMDCQKGGGGGGATEPPDWDDEST